MSCSAERIETLFLCPAQLLCALMVIRHKVKNKKSLRCTFFLAFLSHFALQLAHISVCVIMQALCPLLFEYGLLLLMSFTK